METIFSSLLVLGLVWEFVEAAKVDKHVADIESSNLVIAVQLEGMRSNNLVQARQIAELVSSNLVLALKLEPRADRLRRSSFKDLIKEKAGGDVEILYEPYNGEVERFAWEVSIEMQQSDWKVSSFVGSMPMGGSESSQWDFPISISPETFSSITIVSHDKIGGPQWRRVALDAKTIGEDGTNDIFLVEVKPPKIGPDLPIPTLKDFKPTGHKDRYQLQLPPADTLAKAFEKSGFHIERKFDPSLPTNIVRVLIGTKE